MLLEVVRSDIELGNPCPKGLYKIFRVIGEPLVKETFRQDRQSVPMGSLYSQQTLVLGCTKHYLDELSCNFVRPPIPQKKACASPMVPLREKSYAFLVYTKNISK